MLSGGLPDFWACGATISGRRKGGLMEVPHGSKRILARIQRGGIARRAGSGIRIAQWDRQAGVHENTIHVWKRDTASSALLKFVEMNELRDQNTRLKRLVANLSLEKVMLQAVLSKKAL